MVRKMAAVLLMISILAVSMLGGCGNSLDKDNPVSIIVWNYYSGYQQVAFDAMVKEFNETAGLEKGIMVHSVGQGSIEGLMEELEKTIEGTIGAQDRPDLVSLYSGDAYPLDAAGELVSLDNYFSEKEKEEFIDSFLEEGRLGKDGELKIIPIVKSTEMLMYNKTDFDKFAASCGVDESALSTMEGIAEISKIYYEYTDNQTPDVPEDGKALFGRDSISNYVVMAAKQLGQELLVIEDGKGSISWNEEVMRRIWDNYYIPYINGYYGAYGRFRSDDAKLGKVLVSVGSSSGIDFFPRTVTRENDSSYDIEIKVMKSPSFEGCDHYDIQQGAGYAVLRSEEKKHLGAVEFLKWITRKEINTKFAVDANYMPVTKGALDMEFLSAEFVKEDNQDWSEECRDSLAICVELVNNSSLWSMKPFTGSGELREYLGSSLESICEADRKKVEASIAMGSTREEATAEFTTDVYFKEWYNALQEGAKSYLVP